MVRPTQTWIDAPAYDVRGDVDLDGDTDLGDKSLIIGNSGTILRNGVLSSNSVNNTIALAGGRMLIPDGSVAVFRTRACSLLLGRWLSRDMLDYDDGLNLVNLLANNPIVAVDALGTKVIFTGDGGEWIKCMWECLKRCSPMLFARTAKELEDSVYEHEISANNNPHDDILGTTHATTTLGVLNGGSEIEIDVSGDNPSWALAHEAMHAKQCEKGAGKWATHNPMSHQAPFDPYWWSGNVMEECCASSSVICNPCEQNCSRPHIQEDSWWTQHIVPWFQTVGEWLGPASSATAETR